jgi:hypothetical protein
MYFIYVVQKDQWFRSPLVEQKPQLGAQKPHLRISTWFRSPTVEQKPHFPWLRRTSYEYIYIYIYIMTAILKFKVNNTGWKSWRWWRRAGDHGGYGGCWLGWLGGEGFF